MNYIIAIAAAIITYPFMYYVIGKTLDKIGIKQHTERKVKTNGK